MSSTITSGNTEGIPDDVLLGLIGHTVTLNVGAGHRHGGPNGAIQAEATSYTGVLSLVTRSERIDEYTVGGWRVTVTPMAEHPGLPARKASVVMSWLG